MIEISNVNVYGWEAAIRGMRNPMNSWDRSDSAFGKYNHDNDSIGENDLSLMKKLIKGGTEHRKFLRMITVTVDINAPLYWWSEYDTYKVGTVANSCSKMHKLLHKPFEMSDFSFDWVSGYRNEVKQFKPEYDYTDEVWGTLSSCPDYSISNYGRIRNRFGRIVNGGIHGDGYIFVNIHGKQLPAHRLVAELYCTKEEGKDFVNHKDGNKMNNAAENLEWVTASENIKHSIDNDLQPKYLAVNRGKFTAEQREEIKKLCQEGHTRREVAKQFGSSHSCINSIVHEKYKYIEKVNIYETVAKPLINTLNELRDTWFLLEDEKAKKQIWYMILQMLPESYNQKRTVQLNYEVLMTQYRQRKNHKLTEWNRYTEWIETLPYMSEFLVKGDVNET